MTLTREDMLRELELLPVWRLRDQPAPLEANPGGPDVAGVRPQALQGEATAEQDHEIVQAVVDVGAEPEPIFSEGTHIEGAHIDEPALALTQEVDAALTEQADYPEESQLDWSDATESVAAHIEMAAPVQDRRAGIMEMNWQALQADVEACKACSLEATRTQTVFGVGDPHAEWLFIGEAPGAEEDRRGEPFVGQAGKLLDNMLAAIKLKRGENVYIANVLKCRPPANRDPQGEEVVKCDPYLKRQVELIQPKLIVALGKFAAQSLLVSESSIAGLRGKLHDFHGVPVIVTYHPAYLLRNLPDKARAWDDLCFARDTMQGLQSAVSASSDE